MQRRWWCGGAVVVLTATACGSSGHAAVPTTAVTTTGVATTGVATTAVPSGAAPTTAPPGTGASATTTVAATTVPATTVTTASAPTVAACVSAHLAGSLTGPNGAAGSTGYLLDLTNTGTTPCTLEGWPGVSFVAGADGHQVGAAARRSPADTPLVRIGPGGSARSVLVVADAADFPASCRRTHVLGLRVYPPDQTAALFVPHTDTGCAASRFSTLSIGPVEPGPGDAG
jgi:hypothetical protein